MSEQTVHNLYRQLAVLLDQDDTDENKKEIKEMAARIDVIESATIARMLKESREHHAKARAELATMKAERLALASKQKEETMSNQDAKLPPIQYLCLNGKNKPVVIFDSQEHYDKVRELLGQETLSNQDQVERIAAACHGVNRTYCLCLNDASQPEWCEAEDWQRESAISGVEAILDGTVSTPEDAHKNWMKDKEADGWKFGSVKDQLQRTHPCMLPYEALPETQKVKDDLFFATVKGLRAEMGI